MGALTSENLAELNKFFIVAKEYADQSGKIANMPSCIVDSCWHELMEDDGRYRSFTQGALGCQVNHLENKGHGLIEWVPVYERLFGELTAPWFITPEGQVDEDAKTHYQQNHEILMSWDCTPEVTAVIHKKPKAPQPV